MPNGIQLPAELQADQQAIEQRKRIANMLIQQSMQGQQGQMAGRFFVPPSPLSAIAQAVQAYQGKKGLDAVDEGTSALGRKYAQGQQSEMERIAQIRSGAPATTDAADNIENPGTPGDPRRSVMEALTSQYPAVQKMGELQYKGDLSEREAKANRLSRLEERQMMLESQAAEKSLDRDSKERIASETNDIRMEIAKLRGELTNQRAPFFQFFPTTEGMMAGNARTGTAAPVVVDGKRLTKPADDPTRQGDIAGAKERAKAEAKRTFNMSGIGQTIDKAEKILKGLDPSTGLATAKPTGSGVGTAIDKAAGFVGISPSGSAQADQLRAVAGALTAKMPRMEGPQSDKDVQLYREAAAQVGDSTIPIENRLAALQVVKDLWAKYEYKEGGAAPTPPKPAAPAGGPPKIANDADYDALPSGTEFIAPDGQLRRKP